VHATVARADRADTERCRVSETFGASAARLGGQAALLLGWMPDAFWAATPEELATVLSAMRQPESGTMDKRTLDKMMEADRGG